MSGQATPVMIEVAVGLIRTHLAGYKGYPNTEAGERRFARALTEVAISVEHANAVLQSFDEGFPTVHAINDVAHNLRVQFEPSGNEQRKEWERRYGKPKAFDRYPADKMALHWQAFRDMLYYTEGPGRAELNKIVGKDEREHAIKYWGAAKIRDFDAKNLHADSILFVRQQVETLGWPAIMAFGAAPESMPYTNPLNQEGRRSGGLAPVGAPITQADIDHARQSRKSTVEVDREMDAWDDPDR